jgi:S1-C subfamily serine protease
MKFAIFVLSLFCLEAALGSVYAAEPQEAPKLADLVDDVRPSVVKIDLHIHGKVEEWPPQVPQGIRECFGEMQTCVVGTGYFVNSNGDVVTAFHVVDGYDGHPGVKQIIELLNATGIHAEMKIGVAVPNIERGKSVIGANTMSYSATLVSTDPAHDIALIRSTKNPFTSEPPLLIDAGAQSRSLGEPKFVTFSEARPRDAEDIFACGYPFGQHGLVTTSGTVASAWNSMPLVRAHAAGIDQNTEVYQVDLRINPGDSGGPVFRVSDESVMGMAIEEIAGGGAGGLGIAIPAKFVTAFLKSQGVPFTLAKTAPKDQPKQKPH